MITGYSLCLGHDAVSLQNAVNQAIRNGWQPVGGVTVSEDKVSVQDGFTGAYVFTTAGMIFCQAVVKITPD